MQDIFIPESKPEDALVRQMHTATYVTADRDAADRVFAEGYDLSSTGWSDVDDQAAAYLGFAPGQALAICGFTKSGEGANMQVRAVLVDESTPLIRPAFEGLYKGGATLSFPMTDLLAHESRMAAIGIESTMGVKEMDFASPTGETYTSAEIVYMAPDHVFLMGVKRPDVFVPTGPIDPATGLGGPAYSARCATETDAVIDFLRDVLGFEIRRDIPLEVGEKSALRMPMGTKERFVQVFAPGSQTGYFILMDHGEVTKLGDAPGYGPPNRGIAMWSFTSARIEEVAERAERAGTTILQPLGQWNSPLMPSGRSMILQDPDGFPFEIVESE